MYENDTDFLEKIIKGHFANLICNWDGTSANDINSSELNPNEKIEREVTWNPTDKAAENRIKPWQKMKVIAEHLVLGL